MSGVTGLVGGLAGLALLDAVVTSGAPGRVGGLFQLAADVLDYWFDPNQPLIPAWHDCSGLGISGTISGAEQAGGNILNQLGGATIGGYDGPPIGNTRSGSSGTNQGRATTAAKTVPASPQPVILT